MALFIRGRQIVNPRYGVVIDAVLLGNFRTDVKKPGSFESGFLVFGAMVRYAVG